MIQQKSLDRGGFEIERENVVWILDIVEDGERVEVARADRSNESTTLLHNSVIIRDA